MTDEQLQIDIVVLEEHYGDVALDAALGRIVPAPLKSVLYATPQERITRLDRLGISTEILALSPPGMQGIMSADAAVLARDVNDRLANFVAEAPDRLAAFAALPTIDPASAADELARCVHELGFVGAMIHGPTEGRFLDDPAFLPIFARAEVLGVPLYMHPSEIQADVRQSYFAPYDVTHPMFIRAGWGYTIETGTHAIRLILSGVFERHPGLQIILGHLGEGIPYMMDRIDEALARDTPMKNFAAVFRRHFHVTTSGFFSDAALDCCIAQLGTDRVMFSIDAPYASDDAGVAWLRHLNLDAATKNALASENARHLLGLRGA